MSPLAWTVVIGLPVAAVGVAVGVAVRASRRPARGWDWPEDRYPSPGMGYPADGDRL